MDLVKNVKTWKQREERMDEEATTNDNDAIDARARWWRRNHFANDTEAECCHDGGVFPYMIRIACGLSSRLMAALFGAAATAGAAFAADSVGASSLSLL